jgi:hypothetical protein
MSESFGTVYGAFLGPDRGLTRSLSSHDVVGSKLLLQHRASACADLKRRAAPSFLTCSAHADHPPHTQKRIQSP